MEQEKNNQTIEKELKSGDNDTINDNGCIFREAIDKYIALLNSQMDSFPIINNTLTANIQAHVKCFQNFIEEKKIKVITDDEKKRITYRVPINYGKKFESLQTEVAHSIIASYSVPRNTVVAMVSFYDAYLAELLECAYAIKPQLLNSCEKEFSFSEIIQFESIDSLKKHIIEKDVESVIRESHSKQLDIISKKFNVSLTSDLPCYNDFIEITERRNLFVHTNGRVSSQYLSICKNRPVDHKDSDVQLGEDLLATPEYVNHCYKTLFEIGVKLGQVIWRKLENDLERADDSLIDIGYDLLKNQKFDLACIITDFSCKPYVKHFNKINEYVLCVNQALAYYLKGDKTKCEQIINSVDWSGADLKYRLAHKVLLEQYNDAVEIMKSIGKTDEMHMAYSEWPLFNNFRKEQAFKDVFKNIYGHDYQYSEPQRPKWMDIIKNAMDLVDEAKEQIPSTEDISTRKTSKIKETKKKANHK